MADVDAGVAENRVSGAIQDLLDEKYGSGHMVTEWLILARELDPDGKRSCFVHVPDDCDRVIAYGLASMAEEEVRAVFGEEED